MKHGRLCSVAHAMADSLASGICLMIGHDTVDVFADAARSPGRELTVDFLNGRVSGEASHELLGAVIAFRQGMPEFCRKQGVAFEDYRCCKVLYRFRYTGAEAVITLGDRFGRVTSTEFIGTPLSRKRVLNRNGSRRRVPRERLA